MDTPLATLYQKAQSTSPAVVLLRGIQSNDRAAVRLAVSMGADINAELPRVQATPLYEATRLSRVHIVSLLLELGADADALGTPIRDDTALDIAARHGHVEIVQILLDHGVALQNGGRSALLVAVMHNHSDIVRLLLRYGADVNDGGRYHMAPLLESMRHGSSTIPPMLLKYGADVNCTDASTGRTPLHLATINGCATAVNLLLDHGAEIEALDKGHNTPLSLACRAKARVGVTCALIRRGANLEVKCSRGDTPLTESCRSGFERNVQCLLAKRADIEARGRDDETPLLAAAMGSEYSICKLLLRRGASVNARREGGALAMHVVQGDEPASHFNRLFIKYGADIDAKDIDGATPLHRAAEVASARDVKYLIEHGADKTIKNGRGRTAEQVATEPEVIATIRSCEFVWSPATHRLIRRAKRGFCRAITVLLLLRNADDAAFAWLPNELMFELFRALL